MKTVKHPFWKELLFRTTHISQAICRSCISLVRILFSVTFLGLIGSCATAQTWQDSLELTFDDGNGNTMPYRLFIPPGHDQPGAEYPLVLFLHRGEFLGSDNRRQVSRHISGLISATQGERFPAFLLAPQTPEPWWYESVRERPMQIVESIEQQYQIDSNRLYVSGTSIGGWGVNDIVSRNPHRFAAAIPISSGLLPDEISFLTQVILLYSGPRPETIAVPEPNACWVQLILLSLVFGRVAWRRQSHLPRTVSIRS